jgi:D-arginine dehydrogenase
VGEAPDAPGFFWLAALSGYGIQTAPATGQLAASLVTSGQARIADRETAFDPAEIAPGRLSLLRVHAAGY